jgi:hypothetical protein
VAPVPAPAPPAPPAATPVAHDAALDVEFASAASEGVLTIYAGERQIVRESFRFVRKSGRFSRERIGGTIAAQRRLPVGPITLRVYVVMPGKPTKAVVVDGVIEAGNSYQLAIRVDAEGRVAAELR